MTNDDLIHFENIVQFANYYDISEYDVFVNAAKDAKFSLDYVEPAFNRWMFESIMPEWVKRYIKKYAFFIA
jgi:hypothetical protein